MLYEKTIERELFSQIFFETNEKYVKERCSLHLNIEMRNLKFRVAKFCTMKVKEERSGFINNAVKYFYLIESCQM